MVFSSNDQGKFISWVIATRSVNQAQRKFGNTVENPLQNTLLDISIKKLMEAGRVLHKK